MAKMHAPVVISANCLLTGAVLYWGSDGRWRTDLAGAQVCGDLDAAAVAVAAATDPSAVIGVDLVPVTVSNEVVAPRHYREAIRATGPGASVLPGERGVARVSV